MPRKTIARSMWIAFGLLALGCGIAGAVLPLVPTTPFLLLAAFAFARGSPRLHNWLMQHKQFGPLIKNWEREGAIDRRTKTVSVIVMAFTPPITWLIGAPWWALVAQIAVLLCAAAFVITRPEPGAPISVPPDEAPSPTN